MPNHRGIPIWDVEIPISGLVTVQRKFSLNVRKEIIDTEEFYSNVRVEPKDYGFLVRLTAFAPDAEQAEQAGLVFLGRMLDVMSIKHDIALNPINPDIEFRNKYKRRVKLILGKDAFVEAFKKSRILALSQTTYLRALGWFRKGKSTTDPLDKFLAFWVAIETVASKYNPNKQACAARGSICHIWESFKHIWGECPDWPIIPGKRDWIDNGNQRRVEVAHGTIATDVESVARISEMLPEVEKVSRIFLLDWFGELEIDLDPALMR